MLWLFDVYIGVIRKVALGILVFRASDQAWNQDRKAWVWFPMPPNTLRRHTECVVVKSVGPKVSWAVTADTTGAKGWGIFPSPPVPCLNWEGGDRWVRDLSYRSPTCLRLRQISFLLSGRTQRR
ncbi:hypothetical protein TNCV_1528881 [Trichonephila clavipes]|uniref:Secreted protein n=1 Tax=Trichonephila clavipes TaxID=2585209 RepID=A0A8X6SHU7_TRICX|nr:hypothetical protein TNCV_1528881 [Trichonephila clavipes]